MIRYQTKTTTSVWTADPECLEAGYTNSECRDYDWGSNHTTVKYGASRLVTARLRSVAHDCAGIRDQERHDVTKVHRSSAPVATS